MNQGLLDSLIKTINEAKAQGQVVDEELIYDTLYGCGTWLNEAQVSEYARELRKIFGVIRAKDLE